MSEAKHTPGPWPINRKRNGATILAIGPCVAEDYAGFAWLEVSEEDASLIAAAPELLAALEAFCAEQEKDFPGAVVGAYAIARAAIAKAKGITA